MKNPLLSARAFQMVLNIGGYFARRPRFNFITRLMMRWLADLTVMMKCGQHKNSLAEIGREWQRMFPGQKLVSIRDISDDTVYAEVCACCPITNTGDVDACHRLMAYDRRLLEHIGGEFIVLESQADPDTAICQVVIRKKEAATADLIPAHKKPLKSQRLYPG